IDRPVWLYGAHHIAIGRQVLILRGAWLAVEKVAWDRPAPVLWIGDRVGIRTSCTITAAASIVIEDDVSMGGYVTVIDSKHVWGSGDNVLSEPVEASPVRIGRGTWIGDKATIAAGANIGVRCMIASNSVVSGTVPDYSVVVGNPGRVIGSTREGDAGDKPRRAAG